MTLGCISAEPEAATLSTLPVMLQLVPGDVVCPEELMVKFCALPSTNEKTATEKKSAVRNEMIFINRN